jgi:tetratricopeptide (TPR) repeat protein
LELVGPHLRTLTPEEIRADFGKLLAKFQQEAPEERNQSLLASLEFSRRHLSPAAREALPWLGLFSGGVFEDNLLDVSQLAPEVWEPIRQELEDIALLRTEADLQLSGRPFLRFHPTLAAAAADPTLAQNPEVRQRFLGVYRVLRQALDRALQGSQSRAALEVLNREEANYRTAVQWAMADQQLPSAARLGDTFSLYLERSGRLRERDAWVQWLKDAVDRQGFTDAAAVYERKHAWTRFTQGDPQGAVDQLEALIERLRQTSEFDPAFQLATTILTLGRVLDHAGASAQAIPILQEAVGHWEALVEKAGGRPWEELLASPDHAKAANELGNLSATMADLANALGSAGQHDEALAVAEGCLRIEERLGRHREVAAGHGVCAQILMAAGRYAEADARYDLALAAACQAGDKELEGTTFQHQGSLAGNRNQLERASRLYQQALDRFQEAGDHQGVMQTYNLLGMVEQKAGRLAEARAWYEKSRELAVQLKDQPGLGAAAQNIGVVWQLEGEVARERGDEPAARRCFEEARRSVEESLQIGQTLGSKPDEADSWSQLARIHLRLSDLAAAERHAPTKPARSASPSASRKPSGTTTPSPRSPKPAAISPPPPSGPRSAMICSPSSSAAPEEAVACPLRCSRPCNA